MAVLAVRLLRLWRRSGELPELLLALFFLAVGPFGFLFVVLATAVPQLVPGWPVAPTRVVGVVGITLGCWLMAVFTWRVFRPGETWAAALAVAAGLGLAAGVLLRALDEGFLYAEQVNPVWYLCITCRTVCFLWSGVEALRYWMGARRRVRLGLTDPVVANRFLLWACWAGAGFFVLAIHIVRALFALSEDFRMTLTVVGGIGCAVAIWLTFFPPQAYRRFLLRRTAAA
jgi:hypothetical protein